MIKITYRDAEGTSREVVDAEEGSTVMETAIRNGVPGIEAECGGACSCATCHVYVDEEWVERGRASRSRWKRTCSTSPSTCGRIRGCHARSASGRSSTGLWSRHPSVKVKASALNGNVAVDQRGPADAHHVQDHSGSCRSQRSRGRAPGHRQRPPPWRRSPSGTLRLIYVRFIVPVTYMEFMPPAFDEEQQARCRKEARRHRGERQPSARAGLGGRALRLRSTTRFSTRPKRPERISS